MSAGVDHTPVSASTTESQKPVAIKFPPRRDTETPLVLPKRRLRSPFESSETVEATKKTLSEIRTATRNPWGELLNLDSAKVDALENSLKQLAAKLDDRERALSDIEGRLEERERNLAECEALLKARESLFEARSQPASGPDAKPLSQREQAALTQLKAEVERQQATLQEQRQALREREAFLDESEAKLFKKVQEHQEKETELEQREEDLRRRERKLREREALNDPAVAAALAAEKAAAKQFDEFNE
jgi:peptidoglycan hydrolase CwlO-like protein